MGNRYSEPIDPNAPVDLRHFNLGRVIGKGAFGKVRIVERRRDKKIFALKYMNKEHIIRQRAYRNIIRERQLLERVFHPFIVNLCYAFQDDEYLFMISDLMLGGDLRFHLTGNDHLPEHVVAFYAAEVASALMYLHSRNVIHRDVKPDNLLLDLTGHVHITDFNCACLLEEGKAIVSETGTQGYMAPEVYTDIGYRESVDWWSLGITLYELLHGERPFAANTIEELAHAVKNDPIEWRVECSPEMLNFVLSLMDRNVGRRLGCGPRGPYEVKEHELMAKHGIDWIKLVDKEIQPPYVPDTEGSNFDARYELEELLLEDQPLAQKPRRRNSPGGGSAGDYEGSATPPHPMARELAILDAEFLHFDYNVYERYSGIEDPTSQSVGEPPEWVRCVDPPVPLPPSTAPSSPNLAATDPSAAANGVATSVKRTSSAEAVLEPAARRMSIAASATAPSFPSPLRAAAPIRTLTGGPPIGSAPALAAATAAGAPRQTHSPPPRTHAASPVQSPLRLLPLFGGGSTSRTAGVPHGPVSSRGPVQAQRHGFLAGWFGGGLGGSASSAANSPAASSTMASPGAPTPRALSPDRAAFAAAAGISAPSPVLLSPPAPVAAALNGAEIAQPRRAVLAMHVQHHHEMRPADDTNHHNGDRSSPAAAAASSPSGVVATGGLV
ncbi:kinase-like domain-containing protein [Blastocladiella britannica]|nr:kinase-like domain-containing protein [Blastocladiella britannica]